MLPVMDDARDDDGIEKEEGDGVGFMEMLDGLVSSRTRSYDIDAAVPMVPATIDTCGDDGGAEDNDAPDCNILPLSVFKVLWLGLSFVLLSTLLSRSCLNS